MNIDHTTTTEPTIHIPGEHLFFAVKIAKHHTKKLTPQETIDCAHLCNLVLRFDILKLIVV